MPDLGYPLTGLDPKSPIPGLAREFRFAQGTAGGAGPQRSALFYGNKTSSGSETANTIGDPIQDFEDGYARFGRRSEIMWDYRMFMAVPQEVLCYAIATPEASGSAAATVTFTFATTATASTNLVIQWGDFKAFVPVASGDTAIVQAAAVVAMLTDWEEGTMPFTSAVGSGGSEHIVTVTSANTGTRGGLVLKNLRMYYQRSVSTTVTKGSVTEGTGEDDFTTAYGLAAVAGPFYYQVNPKHSTSSPSATDNGMGEGAAMILTQALPVNGKGQQMIFGFVGTNSELVTVCTALNNVRCKVYWAENSPWTPGMIAAHAAAIQRVQELAHPSANLAGYTSSDTNICLFPAPYSADDRPTQTEVATALNNGGSVIEWDRLGKSRITRSITTRSLQGSSNDYRAREGHIPSAIDYAWDDIFVPRWTNTVQPFVASDPVQGQPVLAGVQYPSASVALMRDVINDLTGGIIAGRPVLDPSPQVIAKMLKSVAVIELADGISMKADLAAVRHNLKTQVLWNEVGPAY